ncbi:hypothetical protein BDR06DRAFT_968450 [Suillus hirtellus]|nr:hypothetical protein BDR06DRAFT_968450 [Suillus hirtellus]
MIGIALHWDYTHFGVRNLVMLWRMIRDCKSLAPANAMDVVDAEDINSEDYREDIDEQEVGDDDQEETGDEFSDEELEGEERMSLTTFLFERIAPLTPSLDSPFSFANSFKLAAIMNVGVF